MQVNHFVSIEIIAENKLPQFPSFPFLVTQTDVFGLTLVDNSSACIMSILGLFVIKLYYILYF